MLAAIDVLTHTMRRSLVERAIAPRRCWLVLLLKLFLLPAIAIGAEPGGTAPRPLDARVAGQPADMARPLPPRGRLEHLPPVTDGYSASAPVDDRAALANYQVSGDGGAGSVAQRIAYLEARVRELEDQQRVLAADSLPESDVVGNGKPLQAIWNHGLDFSSKNKDFRVHIGGRTQFDNSFFSNDPNLVVSPAIGGIGPQPDSFQFRRGRLRVEGTMYANFVFAAEYDFVNTLAPASPSAGQPVVTVPGITDLWGTFTDLPRVGNFRFGNMKEPLGMEHVNSSRFLPFIERSFLHDALFGPFNNGFTPGIMIFDYAEDLLGTWAIGWFSAQNTIFGYGIGDESAMTARVTRLLVYDEPSHGRYLWHVGTSLRIAGADEGEVRIRTRGNIRSGPPGVLNPIYADTGTMAAHMMNIVGLETAFVSGPLSVQAEFSGVQVTDAFQPYSPPQAAVDRGDVYFYGGYVEALWFLTGEHMNYSKERATFDRVTPFENFFLLSAPGGKVRGRGAWQLGARYDTIKLNDAGINGGILHGFTFGLNWYWNPNSKWQFNYDLTHRSHVKEVPSGFINGWGIRYAMDF